MKAKFVYEFLDTSNEMQLVKSSPFNPSDLLNKGVVAVKDVYDMGIDGLQLVIDYSILNYSQYLENYEVEDIDEEFYEQVLKLGEYQKGMLPFMDISFYVQSTTDKQINNYGVLSDEYNTNFVGKNMAAVIESLNRIISKFPTNMSIFVMFNGIETEKDVQRKTRDMIRNNFVSKGMYLTSRDKLYLYSLKKNFNIGSINRIDTNVVVEILR